MSLPFVILSEFQSTWGVGGIVPMPRVGYIGENGRCTGFNPDVPLDQLLDYWCGPVVDGERVYCRRVARQMRSLPPEHRWLFLGGGFGNVYPEDDNPTYRAEHRRITLQAIGLYEESMYRRSALPIGIIADDEDQTVHLNASDLQDLLFDSGPFHGDRVRCVNWYAYYGDGVQMDEHYRTPEKPKPKTLLPGRPTACVHAYLRHENEIGVDLDEQVRRNVRQAIGAMEKGYGFVPLVSGGKYYHGGTVMDTKMREAYYSQARQLASLGPVAVWLFGVGGQGVPAIKDPGVDYTKVEPVGVWDNTKKANVTECIEDMLATVEAWSATDSDGPTINWRY